MNRLSKLLVIALVVLIVSTAIAWPSPHAVTVLVIGVLVIAAIATVGYLLEAFDNASRDRISAIVDEVLEPEDHGCKVPHCTRHAVTLFAPLNIVVCGECDNILSAAYSQGHNDGWAALAKARASRVVKACEQLCTRCRMSLAGQKAGA